jgi:hypothetical protein
MSFKYALIISILIKCSEEILVEIKNSNIGICGKQFLVLNYMIAHKLNVNTETKQVKECSNYDTCNGVYWNAIKHDKIHKISCTSNTECANKWKGYDKQIISTVVRCKENKMNNYVLTNGGNLSLRNENIVTINEFEKQANQYFILIERLCENTNDNHCRIVKPSIKSENIPKGITPSTKDNELSLNTDARPYVPKKNKREKSHN